MQAVAQSIPNSYGYIKCGEILKCQKSYQDSYLLQCIQCKEIYLLLESFIFHLDANCKRNAETKRIVPYNEDCSTIDDGDGNNSHNCEIEQPSVKLDNNNDPMVRPYRVLYEQIK